MRALLIASAMGLALAAGGCRMSNAPDSGNVAPPPRPATGPASSTISSKRPSRPIPAFAVSQGRHEYDGQIADLSRGGNHKRGRPPEEGDRRCAGLHRRQADARAALPARLSGRGGEGPIVLDRPGRRRPAAHNPASYLSALDPSVYVTVPYAPKEERLKSYIKFLQNIPRAAEQMRANIQTPMATSFVDYAKSAFGGFAEYYPGDGMAAWKGVGSAEDQQALKAATDNAVKAMQDTVAWVESQRGASKPNFALGKDKFQRMLADTEMVTTPVDQLERIGRADLASNQKLLGEACGRYARRPDARSVHGEDERQQAGGRRGRRRAGAARGPQAVHHRPRHRDDPGPGASQGRGSAALQPAELRLHQHPRAVRKELAVGLLYRPARPELAQGRAGRVHARPGRSAVHLGPRSVAGPLPQLPPRQPLEGHVRPGVRRLRLCRRLGALYRGDDARRRRRRRHRRDA